MSINFHQKKQKKNKIKLNLKKDTGLPLDTT